MSDRVIRDGGNQATQAESRQWYAAYTCSRHEKRVAEQMELRAVEHFLPLYEAVHRWKNGRHRVQLPLFPGYVFFRIALKERLGVLQIPGLVQIVGFGGVPCSLPEKDILAMRDALIKGMQAEPHPYLPAGTRVKIMRGPLAGLTGVLVRYQTQFRVVLSVDLIMRSVAVDVQAADIALLESKPPCQAGRVDVAGASIPFAMAS